MKHSVFYLFLFLATSLSFLSCEQLPTQLIPVKSASSDKGMVVTAHPIATEIGLDILKQGGNAADAAVAVQFALAVVYPRAGNIGGGGFLVYRDQTGEVTSLDYREKAPLASHKDMYLDSLGNIIPNLSTEGILAAGVPGTIAGLFETHKRFGSLPWATLVEPAIQLAGNGFRISQAEANRLNEFREIFAALNPADMPFLKKGEWKNDDKLIQKDLAHSLALIAQKGVEGFYQGEVAKAFLALSKEKNGIITQNDLDAYQAKWRTPITNRWRGFEVHSMGLPSSGGVVLGQILGMIEDQLIDSLGFRHPDNLHLVIEAERRAYTDRATYLGDLDYYPVIVDSLLTDEYLKNKFKDFDATQATKSISLVEKIPVFTKDHFETTHLSIVDQFGNAASVTTTLNDNFGCKVWVPGAGYFLNNEMDDFSAKPGTPNIYGLIGGEANAIAPQKRMLSSMTPTIIEKNDQLCMVLGTPGGSTIITSVLQVFLNVAAFDMNIDEAVQASRYHHQWLPDEIMIEENAFSPSVQQALQTKGHTIRPISSIGLIEAILIDEDGIRHGAADARGDDHAAGG